MRPRDQQRQGFSVAARRDVRVCAEPNGEKFLRDTAK
jgi:hypothetical protein